MSLEKVIEQIIENRLANVHTAIPAEIISYDSGAHKASVKPTIKREYKDGQSLEYPVINSVPVVWTGTSDGVLHFDLKKGDGCLLIFAERSLDVWLSRGGIVSPNDRRKHSLSDAIAIPGLFSFNQKALGESGLVLKNGTAKLKLENNKVALGNDQEELLDLFEQTLTALENATTITSIGTQPLVNKAQFTNIKTLLAKIKGSL